MSDHDESEERYQARADKAIHIAFVVIVLAALIYPIVRFWP